MASLCNDRPCVGRTQLAARAVAADPPEAGTNTIHGIIQFINADADIRPRLGPPGEEGMTNVSFFAYTDPPDVIQTTKVLYSRTG